MHYELLYIISSKLTENEIQPVIDNITQLIEKSGGKILKNENWGKRKLAYPIEHLYHGYYILNEFELEPSELSKLNKELKITNEIVRSQIVKIIKRTVKKVIKKPKSPEKINLTETPETTEIKKEEKAEKKKVSMEELEEKLDKILDMESN